MSADLIAVLLLLLFVFATVLHAVHKRVNEPIPYMPVDREEDWDRHVAEAIAHTQIARFDQPVGAVLHLFDGGKR